MLSHWDRKDIYSNLFTLKTLWITVFLVGGLEVFGEGFGEKLYSN